MKFKIGEKIYLNILNIFNILKENKKKRALKLFIIKGAIA